MFGIGVPELLLILAIALIVIGPKKLPDLAKSMGRAMREFKKATGEIKESLSMDADLNDVKEAFDDIKGDLKHSLDDPPKREEKKISEDKKVKTLDETYEEWIKQKNDSEPPSDLEMTDDQPIETPESEPDVPENDPKK